MSAGTLQTFSIRTKLLLFVASLVVAVGALSGLIAASSGRAALTRVIGRQLSGEARNAADRLATVLRAQRDGLAAFARQDVMREIRIGDLDKRISSFLVSARGGCPICLDLSVVDSADRVVAASDPALLGQAGVALAGGADRPPIDGPLLSPAHGRPLLRLRTPIPDPDAPERRLGWLVARLDWDRVTALTAEVRDNLLAIDIDADVLVIDAAGVVIGGTPRRGGRWRPGEPTGVVPAAASSPSTASLEPTAGVLLGTAALAADLPAWAVLVAEPVAEAFAPVRRMVGVLAAVLAAMLLIALAIALAAAGRVTRPLVALTQAARAVGRGDAPPPTAVTGSHDEIGTLAAAFDRMASELGRAERRLVEAAKFAYVGELAAGVAHEVRTPLGVLRSSAQLLGRSLTASDDESRELLQLVRDEVDRIERVVSGLLELGRPRHLRLEPVALGSVVFRAADFVEVQARTEGIVVRRRPAVPDPEVAADPDLLYQVALNLLVNALQSLTAGHAIELAVLPPEDGHAVFEVRDDGPGVPADLREAIFQPFFTRREGGTGLGLTFVQRTVLEHRGRVLVRDHAGGGTVFRVELPVVEVPS